MTKPKKNSKGVIIADVHHTFTNADGSIKRHRENKSFKNMKDAVKWQKTRKKELELVQRTQKSEPAPIVRKGSLIDAAEKWLAECKRLNLSKLTLEEYARRIEIFILFLTDRKIEFASDVQLCNLQDYSAYLSNLKNKEGGEKLGASSRNTIECGVRSFLTFASEHYHFPNPAGNKKWKYATVKKKKVSYPTKEQYEKFLKVAEPKLVPVVKFVSNTGLRTQELIDLKWKNIDEGEDSITFAGKGGKVRTVGLNEIAKSILKELHSLECSDEQPIFQFSKSRPLRRNDFIYSCTKAFLEIGLKRGGLHKFRHYFSTQLLLTGKVTLKQLSLILGHSSVVITEMHYAHVIARDFVRSVDVLVNN